MNNLLKSIPYIDTQKLLSNEISPNDFLKTLHQFGFVYLYNLDFDPIGLNAQMFNKIESSARDFFSLPLDIKRQYYIGNSPNHRGYVPTTEKGSYGDEKERTYEAFDMSYPLKNATKEDHEKLRGDNLWPHEISNFQKTCEDYYNKLFLLGQKILGVFSKSFNLPENHFEQYIKYPASQLRLLHYLPNENLTNRNDVTMGGHTDYECFTLLYQSSPATQGYSNGEFFNLPVFKNSLLLLTGDMMHFMTNSYLTSFYHRVINNGTERFSFPFFMNFDFETELSVLPKFKNYQNKKNNLFSSNNLPNKIITGHHLLGQLYRDFPYIKAKIDHGDWDIPFEIPEHNLFENKEVIDRTNI